VSIARSFTGAASGCAPPVCTANVAVTNLPVSSCVFQTTKLASSYVTHDPQVAGHATETQHSCVTSVGRQTLNADEMQRRGQLTESRSLLALTHRPMPLSQSADRMTQDSQYMRQPVEVHGTSVQRSHSFTTTSHQLPTNIGLISVLLVLLLS